MPTPVGPVAPDPNDPDLWDEWYDGDEADRSSYFRWPVRAVAFLVLVGLVALFVTR